MDELRGPNIQIILHVKEGLGFGFLRTPFVVSGSLNGYMLETDPVIPCHAPVFDAELVWEADKRRFRSLRVQNVPIKVEVYTMGTQGRKDKIGYLLLSLLGAQPCPANKLVDIKYSLHRLLGVKSEGKCCHPQLLMSLSIGDRINTLTPRNELRMFHSNEVAYPSKKSSTNPHSGKSVLLTLNEYIAESKKTAVSPDIQPRLICDEGLIQIGDGKQMFVLNFVIGAVENLDMLLSDCSSRDAVDCYVTYSVFTHNVTTDRVSSSSNGSNAGSSVVFNQRTSLRLRSSLSALGRYFTECPSLVTRVCAADKDIGICSMDLRKLVPTDDIKQFVNNFCNGDKCLTIHERCFLLRCDDEAGCKEDRRPFVDIEMSLKYIGIKQDNLKPPILTARSITQLESGRRKDHIEKEILDCKSGSCTNLDRDVGEIAYTSLAVGNTARYKNASGDSVLQTNEIAQLIKKMCDSFALSQEKLLASRLRPITSDMQVQCEPDEETKDAKETDGATGENEMNNTSEPIKLRTSKSDTCVTHNNRTYNEKDVVKTVLSPAERDVIIQKFVDELEDWKEKQKELFKCQLKRKEDYHLELLAKEWEKKRLELETKLNRGIEQCRNLAGDLSRATDDFRLRGYRNTEREKKLLEAKKALEAHYTAKYQELREVSQKMEDDMNHQLKLKDMKIEELELKVAQLEKRTELLKNNLKNIEKEAESKYSGLTKDQTASLIQELRCVEQKLDSATQSKAFFKEQWARAVRELHLLKLRARARLLGELRARRRSLGAHGLDPIQDEEDPHEYQDQEDLNRLKDDFYVDILANTPVLESHSVTSTTIPDFMEMCDDNMKSAPKNPLNDKLNDLIAQRDYLIQQENPDEDVLKQLNHEIRSILLSCGT